VAYLKFDTFNDPEVALASFRPGQYDLALLDFRMPKMYGHELYDETKKKDNKMRVCFMTATYTNYEALRAAFLAYVANREVYVYRDF
jgi:DNA-binding NtrC family response regulator